MSAAGVIERAFLAAAEREYGGPESRALIRMAMDADNISGENCVTALSRLHQAAGYADDGGRFRTARRTVKRFEADGVIRCDLDVAGIGRVFTVCPVGDWSGEISTRTTIGRKLATWRARHPTPDVQASGATPDTQRSGVNEQATPDTTPDTTPDVKTSDDQRTNGPTPSLTPNELKGRREGEAAIFDLTTKLAASLAMDPAQRVVS